MKKNYNTTTKSGKVILRSFWITFFAITLIMSSTVKSYAQVPPLATNLVCTALNSTTVQGSWDASPGAYCYYVQIDENSTFQGWNQGSMFQYIYSPTTSYTWSGATQGVTYYLHVASVNSGWAWDGVATSPAGATTPIPLFTFSEDIGTTLLASWTAIPGASLYTLQWREHGTTNWNSTPGLTNLSIKIRYLQAYTNYDFRLVIYKNGTFWAYSQTETYTTGGINFYTSFDIGTTLQLTWNYQPFASNYIVQYRQVGSPTWIGIPANSFTNSVKISNLLPNQYYECQLKVYKNNTLWGVSQLGNFNTGYTGFYVNNDIGTTLQLDWNFSNFNPWDASSYTLQYRPWGSSTWTSINNLHNNYSKIANLLAGGDYFFRIRVYKNNMLWGTTEEYHYYTASLYFSTLVDNGTSMDIEFPTFFWANEYQLQYSLPAMTTWINTATTTNNYTTISPILNGQDYYVRLRVYDWNGYWGTTKEQKVGRSSPSGKSLSIAAPDNSSVSTDLNLYPNPFVEQINLDITSTQDSPCTWTLYDITGKAVISGNQDISIGNNTLNIDASQLSKGVYMLTTIINTEKHDFRILKQ